MLTYKKYQTNFIVNSEQTNEKQSWQQTMNTIAFHKGDKFKSIVPQNLFTAYGNKKVNILSPCLEAFVMYQTISSHILS